MNGERMENAPDLPPPPERPDCCFGGCAQCVLDDYTEAMARWQAEVDAIARARRAEGELQGRRTPPPEPPR
ncbi:MAG: oxidoreductase-like domain-containing protein [Sinimarinibacterium flocculans]|uniref:oxidoreductase-like domain-containing protein n=1 Tax=Sinimarinibacterium flocculans TaxID=985250 RepID=UPI003C31F093